MENSKTKGQMGEKDRKIGEEIDNNVIVLQNPGDATHAISMNLGKPKANFELGLCLPFDAIDDASFTKEQEMIPDEIAHLIPHPRGSGIDMYVALLQRKIELCRTRTDALAKQYEVVTRGGSDSLIAENGSLIDRLGIASQQFDLQLQDFMKNGLRMKKDEHFKKIIESIVEREKMNSTGETGGVTGPPLPPSGPNDHEVVAILESNGGGPHGDE